MSTAARHPAVSERLRATAAASHHNPTTEDTRMTITPHTDHEAPAMSTYRRTGFCDPVTVIADTLSLLPEDPRKASAGDLARLHAAIRDLGALAVALREPHDDLARVAGQIDCDADAVRAEAAWLGAITGRSQRALSMAHSYVAESCPQAAAQLAASNTTPEEGI